MARRLLASLLCCLGLLAWSADARAKSASVEWKKIQGAEEYEIEVRDSSGKEAYSGRTAKSRWKGELGPGFYSYRIRGVDWLKRAGKWTDAKALVIMPEAPRLVEPRDGERIETVFRKAPVRLRWKSGAAESVRVTVRRGEEVVFRKVTRESGLSLPPLPPGDYSWELSPVIEASGRAPAALQGRSWEAASDTGASFEVTRKELGAAAPVSPSGPVRPPADGKIELVWKAVEGATGYEVTLSRADAEGTGAKTLEVKDVRAAIPLSGDGSYRWQVRALASAEPADKSSELVKGRQSTAEFQVDRNSALLPGSGYVAFSSMLAPYTYQAESPSSPIRLTAASSAVTLRLSGEYWLAPRLGVSAGLENTLFQINSASYQRGSYELHAKYRVKLDEGRFGWFLAPKAGLELRDYFELIPSLSGSSLLLTDSTFHAAGASVGVDLRRQFSDRWSVGAKFAYFLPLTLLGTEAGTAITSELSSRNLSFGLQAIYWLQKNWSLGAGAFLDQRSLSVQLPSASSAEKVRMDGTYFFGSVIYSFGNSE